MTKSIHQRIHQLIQRYQNFIFHHKCICKTVHKNLQISSALKITLTKITFELAGILYVFRLLLYFERVGNFVVMTDYLNFVPKGSK